MCCYQFNSELVFEKCKGEMCPKHKPQEEKISPDEEPAKLVFYSIPKYVVTEISKQLNEVSWICWCVL